MRRMIFRNLYRDIPGVVVVCLSVALASSLMAQTAGTGVLTGRLTDAFRWRGCKCHRDGDERRHWPDAKGDHGN